MAKIKRLPNKSQFYIQSAAAAAPVISKFSLTNCAVSNQGCDMEDDMDEEMTVEEDALTQDIKRVASIGAYSNNIEDASTNHSSSKA